MMAFSAIRVADGVTSEHSGARVVILSADGTTMTTLNPVGAIVWGELADAPSREALVEKLAARFADVEVSVLESDVAAFVDELCEAGLLIERDPSLDQAAS